MNSQEANALFEDLEALKSLRQNRFWQNRVLPEIERLRAEHRNGMRDQTLSPAQRCEHVTGFDDAQTLLDFPDKSETRMRADLQAHDKDAPIIERRFT